MIGDRLLRCASIHHECYCARKSFFCRLFGLLCFLKLIVLLTNREIIGLIGIAWLQTESLFESINQSSINLTLSGCPIETISCEQIA